VSPDKSFERPPLPPDFDDSRARERRDDPAGWRFAEGNNLRIADGGRGATFSGLLDHDLLLRVRIERDHGNGLWVRLQNSR